MKKFTLAALVAIAAAAFTSCGNGTPKANLGDNIDSLSYAIGVSQSDGIKGYLSERLGVDTAYIDEFLKGVTDGATAGDDKKKAAYVAGLQIGQQIGTQMLKGANTEIFGADSTKTLSLKNILAGFAAGTKEKGQLMTTDQARKVVETTMRALKEESMSKQFGAYKKQNEAYLVANGKKEGVKTLPSGVQYKVLTQGTGAVASDTTVVKVHYEGRTIDGQVFDSSYKRGEPVQMRADQVIPGWKEVLTMMPAGSKWEVTIPASLAYGPEGRGQVIKPFSTLIFTIEVVGK